MTEKTKTVWVATIKGRMMSNPCGTPTEAIMQLWNDLSDGNELYATEFEWGRVGVAIRRTESIYGLANGHAEIHGDYVAARPVGDFVSWPDLSVQIRYDDGEVWNSDCGRDADGDLIDGTDSRTVEGSPNHISLVRAGLLPETELVPLGGLV